MGRRAWLDLMLLLAVTAVTAGPAAAAEALTCEPLSVAWDRHEYRCPLTADGNERRLRFKADFSGGHDDTEASMALTLDGAPLACDPGSKTRLFGEDGDVSLECRLVLAGPAGTQRVLGAKLRFSHAEFVAIELSAP
jgi:hypothetical protein